MDKPRLTLPSQSLLQGKPYVPAASTDIRQTFARVIKQQRQHLKAVAKGQRGCSDVVFVASCACVATLFLLMSAADWLPGGVA